MAILKIEVVEGPPGTDIIYKNPYDQAVVFANSPERLKAVDAAANCLVIGKDETINFRGTNEVYLAVPDQYGIPYPVKHIQMENSIIEKNWRSAEAFMEARANEMERRIDQAKEKGLATWQSNNCTRCVFADPDKVGTGDPCCTRVKGAEPLGAVCLARRER